MNLNHEEIVEYLESLDKEARAIKSELFRMCYAMHGGVTYEEMTYLGPLERESMQGIISENIKLISEIGHQYI